MSRVSPLVVCLVFIASAPAQLVWTKADDGRAGHALAAHPSTGRTLLFGGANSSGLLPDTWEWRGTSWAALTPSRMPPPRRDHAMAAGPGGRFVLFGGVGSGGLLGDTWEWDGTTWTQRFPSFAPTPRGGHAMAFDTIRERTVLFGGSDATGFLGGVWEWDGSNWAVYSPFSGAPPRRAHGLAFEAARGVTVLFGGRGTAGLFNDTWTWNGSFWSRGVFSGPSARQAHAMAYDPFRQRTVLFGGSGVAGPLGDTWEHDGTAWQAATASVRPSPRSGSVLAYDGSRRRVVLYGGLGTNGYLADSWVWDGTAWSEPEPLVQPPPRDSASVVFDEARRRTLMFGGFVSPSGPHLADTWEFDGVRWRQLQPPHTPGPRAEAAIAYDSLRQTVVLWGGFNTQNLTDTWEWDGSDWIQRTTVNGPTEFGRAAFDRARGVTVLWNSVSGQPFDTWEWDGIAWQRRWATNPPGNNAYLAYDETRSRVITHRSETLFTNPQQYFLRTWSWSGNQWEELPPSPPTLEQRNQAPMACDAVRGRVVSLSVDSRSNPHCMEWDGTTWRERFLGRLPSPTNSPLTFDRTRGRVVLVGRGAGGMETWECYTVAPAAFSLYGTGCPGTAGTPTLFPGQLPWAGSTAATRLTAARPFTSAILFLGFNRTAFAGGALPFSLAPFGAPLCQLLVPPELALAANTSVAGTASVDIPFPEDPLWIGVELFQQFAVLDPGANALGLAFSNGGAAVVGAR